MRSAYWLKRSVLCFSFLSVFGQEIPLDCRKVCAGGSTVETADIQCSCLERMGDLTLTIQQRRWIKNPNVDTSASRGGAAHQEPWRAERTTDGFYRIPFILDPELYKKNKHLDAIHKSLSVLNALTCLKFEPASFGDDNKIEFIYGKDCSSQVGKQGGTQKVSVGKRCGKPGIVLHEIMHALGFWHEHSRHDRDNYVKVLFQNIKENTKYNFFKKSAAEIDTYKSPYDYKSILHYNSYAFSKNQKATILRADNSKIVNTQRIMLSEEDQYQLRAMYQCRGVRGISETEDCMHLADRGVSYRGKLSRTVSGLTCQRWDEITPHKHIYFPSHVTGSGLEKNYCRNPDIDEKPWCYTTSPSVEWDYCDIPLCTPAVPQLEIPNPLQSIRGFWTEFSSWSACGVTCGQGTQTRVRYCLGSHPGSNTCPGDFWERKSCTAATSCPTDVTIGEWTQWYAWSTCNESCGFGRQYRVRGCSTAFCGSEMMEEATCRNKYCPLYPDGDCYDDADPDSYTGTRRVSRSGRVCIKWSRTEMYQQASQRRTLNLDLNFCRNPDQDPKGPYCYTNKKSVKKYCDVSVCNSNAAWSRFTSWSGCSVNCGGGIRYKTRTCEGGVVSQGSCDGDVMKMDPCNDFDCDEFVGVDNTINSEEVPVTETPAFTEALSFGKGCAEVGNARAYRGTASTTYRGLTCQHWDSMHPHSHKYRTIEKFRSAGLAENYCRAPDEGDQWPWCYVLSYDVIKQECDIPVCNTAMDPPPSLHCFDKAQRRNYRGITSTTLSGFHCQRWDENFPHPHLTYKPFRVLDQGLGPHNYCRNPDGDAMPWCVTTNPDKFWEYCDVSLC